MQEEHLIYVMPAIIVAITAYFIWMAVKGSKLEKELPQYRVLYNSLTDSYLVQKAYVDYAWVTSWPSIEWEFCSAYGKEGAAILEMERLKSSEDRVVASC